ncbi:MAG: 4,5-DOPA dioxygenase extradiol [Bacteroidota bacterium]
MKMNELNKVTGSLNQPDQMPLLFLGHGSPMNAIEENEFVSGWRTMGITIPRPVAILCISAHWETRGTFVTAMEKPKTIHDFGGFPEELFAVQYPAPGSLGLANEIKKNITKTKVESDEKWGLDHGCWSVVRHLYPDADIPVVQLSLDYHQCPLYHYELAKELASLRRRGVLIIGSGNMVHNLHLVSWKDMNVGFGFDWALEANEKMKKFILNGNHQDLINYKSNGLFSLAIPTPDHFLPLLYVLALKEENESVILFNDKVVAGSLSMTSLKIDKT